MDAPPREPGVFVSYAHADADLVNALREALDGRGVDTWTDYRELAAGDVLDDEIRAAIDAAGHMIVVLSLAALSSKWVLKEVEYARQDPERRIIPVLLPPFRPEMASWLLGEDTRVVTLEDGPAAIDDALPEIIVALGLELPEATTPGTVPEERTLADLVLALSDPGMVELDGTRRASARARLRFRPADGSPEVTSAPFRFNAPIGPIEAQDLAWYLERYSSWPSPIFQVRAHRIEEQLPLWGRRLYDALDERKTRKALDAWHRADAGSRRFSVLVDEVSLETAEDAGEAATLLLSLPWELIHDGESYLFRGARGVRVRRQLPVREARTPILTPAPIRVLLVSPRPEDDSAVYIDHRVSARPLIQALDPLGARVELRILVPPTFKALDAELQRAHDDGRPYHVVHFDGHGVYDKKHGLGALCCESSAGASWLRG
jgi:hypothetical protein